MRQSNLDVAYKMKFEEKMDDMKELYNQKSQRLDLLKQYNSEIDKAHDILIAGGGPTAIEMVAELLIEYKEEKNITIQTNSDR